jgi:neuronal cell adhesion molecule
MSTFDDGFNITWTTSDQINAASLFYIKYKKTDDLINQAAPYLRTPLTTDNFYFLNELERGTKYSVILVATTGTENVKLETESDPVILKTTGQARASRNVATEPWFIGMMVAIALLLIILINVCVLVRERGGKYSVQEKEPFQNQMLSPDGGFDEYQKSGDGMANPPIISGSSNVYFDERQFHDEDDSMAEYGNGENGKFNEDGSFIGLYGRDRVQTYVVQYNQNTPNTPGGGAAPATSSSGDNAKPYSTFV